MLGLDVQAASERVWADTAEGLARAVERP